MKYSLLIHSSPWRSQNQQTALRFARALIAEGHELYRVFFQHEAVLVANALAIPDDNSDLQKGWQELSRHHGADLVLCVSSAIRRGVLNEFEAKRHEKGQANLAEEFVISGLGQLVDACAVSDRVVTFGANH